MAEDNFGSSFSDAFANQQKIAVAEENNRLTAEQQRYDNIRKTLGIANEISKAAADAGSDPMKIAGAIEPVIQSAASLARTPDEAARITAIGRAMLARPATGVNGQVIQPQPQTDQLSATPQQTQLPQTDVITPSQVAQANPPTFDERFGKLPPAASSPEADGDVSLPKGAAPVESSAKLKASEIPIGSAKTRTLIENGLTTQNSLDYRAELWLLDPNSVKGIARGKEGAAITNAVIERGTEIAKARGIAPGEIVAQGAMTGSTRKALDQIVKTTNAIEVFENTAIKNGDLLVELAKKADATGIPVVERYLRPARQLLGDTDVSNFKAQMVLWRAEAAKILNNPNLTGVLTNEARNEVRDAISENSSFKQIAAANSLLKRDFKNRRDANEGQISKLMDSFSQRDRPDTQQRPQQELQRLKDKFGLK